MIIKGDEKMDEKKRRLLEAFAKELEEAEDVEQMSLFTKEELDTPADIQRCLITEMGTKLSTVLGEFFFMPFEDDEMLFFSTVMTISDEIGEDRRRDLEAASALIDSVIPCGCFAIADGNRLVYRYTVPFFSDDDEKKQVTMMLTAANAAIETADRFLGYLSLVADENMAPEDMMDIVTGSGPKED